MKLVTFEAKGSPACVGAVLDDRVVDLAAASDGAVPESMLALIERGEKTLAAARAAAKSPPTSAVHVLADVRLRAPLPNPPSLKDFFAFEDHALAAAKRSGKSLPEVWYELPCYFKTNPREIYGPGDELPWPSYTRKLDFECEVACVVGREGRDLGPEQAAGHIFGYMLYNDLSARDIQKKELALGMGPGKGKDFANAFGPWLVTADEADPAEIELTVRVNDEEWSIGHFRDQYWKFPLLLSHLSQGETVYPGDVFGSGTFHKGCGLDLDRWIKPGDRLEFSSAALGTLKNTVGAPKSRRRLDYRKQTAHHGCSPTKSDATIPDAKLGHGNRS